MKYDFEVYLNYEQLQLNDLSEFMKQLNDLYKTIDIAVFTNLNKYRLEKVLSSEDDSMHNLEVVSISMGSIKLNLKGRAETIAIKLSIIGALLGMTVDVKDLLPKHEEKTKIIVQDEKVIAMATKLVELVEKNPNLKVCTLKITQSKELTYELNLCVNKELKKEYPPKLVY